MSALKGPPGRLHRGADHVAAKHALRISQAKSSRGGNGLVVGESRSHGWSIYRKAQAASAAAIAMANNTQHARV